MPPMRPLTFLPALVPLAPLVAGLVAAPTVRGTVQTAEGSTVVGAEVWLVGGGAGDSTLATTTDAGGAFRFSLPLAPASAIVVRRLGFADVRQALGADAPGRRTVDVRAVTMAPRGAPAVRAVVRDSGAFTGHAASFYRRLAQRRVDVVTRADLLRMRAARISNALRLMPGVVVESGGGGMSYVRLRDRRCYAALYLDGTSMGAGRAFDVDATPVASVLGIELFGQPTGMPIEYQSAESTSCGVVALWTRRDDDQTDGPAEAGSVAEPASVRTAADVETPARLVDSAAFAPRYPAAARAERVGGTVLVELVVDTLGDVERGTVGVAAAAGPELTAATLRAVTTLQFTPARAGGRRVRQLVHLAAEFRPAR